MIVALVAFERGHDARSCLVVHVVGSPLEVTHIPPLVEFALNCSPAIELDDAVAEFHDRLAVAAHHTGIEQSLGAVGFQPLPAGRVMLEHPGLGTDLVLVAAVEDTGLEVSEGLLQQLDIRGIHTPDPADFRMPNEVAAVGHPSFDVGVVHTPV